MSSASCLLIPTFRAHFICPLTLELSELGRLVASDYLDLYLILHDLRKSR
jgi:hypothetical protein